MFTDVFTDIAMFTDENLFCILNNTF